MRYFHVSTDSGQRLIVDHDGTTYDLTAITDSLTSFTGLARTADVVGKSIDELTDQLLTDAEAVTTSLDEPLAPIEAAEVWAAGVTYQISEEARESESGMPEMYLNVYESERPEVFFKATPNRTVGPDEAVGIRTDSDWDVPEPELGIVLYNGEPVGYTIGNDMSSRSIEGENPLYLPQAKVYDRCCSIGPCIVSPETIGDPHDLTLSMTIERDGETVYTGETSTSEMDRTCEELVSYYTRNNSVPEASVLLTGTSLVPPEEFTLQEGDLVTIDIESIGTLSNPVITV
ncbi:MULTISPECIES: fumarylacetoacetate hydrolase family protein [Natrialbaceae]|uniref:fumarylacetoacetate hydrolase family protein n=1 Tax=Natrialbaceae TaxID=1644061 RepID=UPI00207C43DB|nr:fumarylacetoacetate hydrolase family protein [Natronococcus sp. CG52]